jgi:predicted Zn-dependent protease
MKRGACAGFACRPLAGCALAVCLGLAAAPVHAQSLGNVLGGILDAARAGAKAPPAAAPAAGSGGSLVDGVLKAVGSSPGAEEEIEIGEGISATVLGVAPPWNSAKAQRYVNLVGRHIARRSERPELPWTFAIVDAAAINAFAAPGGIVLVTRGLYAMLETEDELAAVLAHEIAHVNRQHHYKLIQQQAMVQLGADLAQMRTGRSKALTDRVVGLGAELFARGLDKDAEFEADRDAAVLAARAGYDASAILATLEKLAAKLASDASVQLLFATHPSAVDRIRRLSEVSNPEIEAAAVLSPAAQRIDQDGR